MNPPWGINWQRYHADRLDMPHIEAMGYRAFTTYEWMWSNRDFVAELLSVARPDAIFLNRDHPLSEQKDDQWKIDPAGKGRAHADDWAQKVREGRVYTPLDRTFFLGLNEPDSNQYQRQIDAYNEAYCRRLAQHGLRAAAYSFGVGHPSTVNLQEKAPPDWSHYAASAAAVLEGHHIAALHEYGAPTNYGWGFWCNRSMFCPYPFDVVLDECGIDYGVVQSGELYGWAKFMQPAEYLVWLDGFQFGMAERAHLRTVNILAYNLFSYDHGDGEHKDWHSFDIRPLRGMIEDYPWREYVQPAKQPVTVHLPVVSEGPQQPPGRPQAAQMPALVHPVADSRFRAVTQPYGANGSYYSQFAVDGVPLRGHNGIDFATPTGSEIVAVDGGRVVEAANDAAGYGLYVKLAHDWGESLYAHLSSQAVRVGDTVAAGQRLGLSGSSGNSTGPHLHFGLRVAPFDRRDGMGGFSDPAQYLPGSVPQPANVWAVLQDVAAEFGVDKYLLASLVWAESSFRPDAKSAKGAQGLGQLMPATWQEWSAVVGARDPFNAQDNARVTAAYLAWLLRTLGNEWAALHAYVWGVGNVLAGKQPPDEAVDYATKVLHGRDLLKAVGGG